MSQLSKQRPVTLAGLFKTDIQSYLHAKGFRIQKGLSLNGQLVIGYKRADGSGGPIESSLLYKLAQLKSVPIYRENDVYANSETQLWVDKYRPRALNQVIGHADQIRQLREWLSTWPAKGSAVLISGPPGIGKTTVAGLLGLEAGYILREYNASDVRSAAALEKAVPISTRGLRRELIIMDEVDGMSSSDRGGIAWLAKAIREKKISAPVICIANEKTTPKMKPLVSACIDIPFARPTKTIIAAAVKALVGGSYQLKTITDMCEECGNDIRALLNRLQMQGESSSKEVTRTMFSATAALFGYEGRSASIDDAMRLVGTDYAMVPLMVQESYINAGAKNSLDDIAAAADRVSYGDTIDTRMLRGNNWMLLPDMMANTVAVTRCVSGAAGFNIFPSWLGKNSSRMRRERQLDGIWRERKVARLDMAPCMTEYMRSTLGGVSGGGAVSATDCIRVFDSFGVTRDNYMDCVQEIVFDAPTIPTKLKTAITREYNRGCRGGARKRRPLAPLAPPEEDDALSVGEESDEYIESEYL
jgi:replication factor C subunit 1